MKNQMALSCLISLGMTGCVVHSSTTTRTSALFLRVALENGRSAKTVISPKTLADIQRIEIVPYQEVSSGSYSPISSINAATTTPDDPQLLKIVRSRPFDLASTLAMRGLKAHTHYRIYGQAYDAGNNLISTQDTGSYLDVEIADDDRPTLGTLPIKLVDSSFAGQLHLDVEVDTPFYSDVGVSLFAQSATPAYSIVGPSQSRRQNYRYSFNFSNLKANSNYQIQACASNACGAQNISVSNEPALSGMSLVLVPMPSINLFAGVGWADFNGDGPADFSALNAPLDVAVSQNGVLYVADADNCRVRKIENHFMTTFVGTGNYGAPQESQPGNLCDIARPTGVAVSQNGVLYVADRDSCLIYKVYPDGNLVILAGVGCQDYGDGSGPAYDGLLNFPTCLAVDGGENIYFTEQDPPRIRKIDSSGTLSTITSNGFTTPCGILVEPSGTLLVADAGDNRVKRVENGSVSVVAGKGDNASSGDGGSALCASLAGPYGLARDTLGYLFISESNSGRVRCLSPSGRIQTVATGLMTPNGVTADWQGNVYVTDSGEHRIRRYN